MKRDKWLIVTGFILCAYAFIFSNAQAATAAMSSNEYHLMVLSDIHLGAKNKMNTSPYGTDIDNDLDMETFKSLINNINNLIFSGEIKPEMGLILGDLIDHKSSSLIFGTVNERETQLKDSLSYLLTAFAETSLTYVFGNNDSLKGDYQSFYSEGIEKNHSPYDIAKDTGWGGGFLSSDSFCQNNANYPCIETVNEREGYYTEYLKPHLKLIVLNSVEFNSKTTCDEQCKTQIIWFQNQLQQANQNKESVLVATHIPPGFDGYKMQLLWNKNAQKAFLDALNASGENVIVVLAAHTHKEELQLIKLHNNRIIPVIYNSGLSTSHGNLPSFKYLTLFENNQTGRWQLKNYITYNYVQDAFQKLYDFKSAYCENNQDLSITDCLTQYIDQNKLDELLKKMGVYYTAGNPNYHPQMPDSNADDLIIQ